jgi:hypothetical protein
VAREPQRPDDVALVEVARNLVGPGTPVCFDPVFERLAQNYHQAPGSFVTGDV